jgi:hypothetical protein
MRQSLFKAQDGEDQDGTAAAPKTRKVRGCTAQQVPLEGKEKNKIKQ